MCWLSNSVSVYFWNSNIYLSHFGKQVDVYLWVIYFTTCIVKYFKTGNMTVQKVECIHTYIHQVYNIIATCTGSLPHCWLVNYTNKEPSGWSRSVLGSSYTPSYLLFITTLTGYLVYCMDMYSVSVCTRVYGHVWSYKVHNVLTGFLNTVLIGTLLLNIFYCFAW
jgi:hypothetical protein